VLEGRKYPPNVSLSIAAKKHYHDTVNADTHNRASRPTDEQTHSDKERALNRLANEQREGRQSFTSIINATTDYELMAGTSYSDRNIRVRRRAALRPSFSTGETR
jgi:putative heme iron utilization protein